MARHVLAGLFVLGALLVSGSAFAQVVLHDISGMLWRDRVPDGLRSAHEADLGVPAYSVELLDAGTLAVLLTTTTDEEGRYRFSVGSTQATRSYRVAVTLQTSRFTGFSPARVGNDPLIDSDIRPAGGNLGRTDALVVSLPAPATNIDVGMIPRTVQIGDFAWFDRSENGLQILQEPGLQGLLVEAWSTDRTLRFAEATTDVDGRYFMQLPGWGQYRLRFESPAGTTFTTRFVGDDPSIDSDVIATGPNAGWTGVVDFSSNTISIASVDAGYVIGADGVDVAMDYDSVPIIVYPGFSATWSLRVREGLGRDITSVHVRAAVPVGIQGMSWSCQGVSGAVCPASGTNAVDFTTSLPANGEMRFVFSGQVAANIGPQVTASAEASVTAPQWDALPQNSSAQAIMRNDRLFRDGFQ